MKKPLSVGEGYTTHYWCTLCRLWHPHDYVCDLGASEFVWSKWPDEWENEHIKTDTAMGRINPRVIPLGSWK